MRFNDHGGLYSNPENYQYSRKVDAAVLGLTKLEGASFPTFFASSPSTAIHGSRNRARMRGKSGAIIFLSQETVREKALHLHRLFHRERSQKQCVEGAYALWSDMHCNSRLVANLVPFRRVVTRQFTILHRHFSAHTRYAT